MDWSIIEGHTLLIPTYNRPALLKRLVLFYSKRAASINLLILDSSRPEVVEENSQALRMFGAAVKHVAFPEAESPCSKLTRGLDYVQTRYASFCADDDLVFPDGLKEAISFLDDHSDYVCAHGLYINFRLEKQNIHIGREYAGPSVDANQPGARIFRLFQKYESLFYAVFRTESLKRILPGMAAQATFHYQELFQSVAALIEGKAKRFPSFYVARRDGPPADGTREKWQTHYWFADSPMEVLEHYRIYCDEVWRFYDTHSPVPRLDKGSFYKVLDLSHAVFFSNGCPPEYFYSVLQHHWPNDPFHKIADVDLFDRLKSPFSGNRPFIARVYARIKRELQIILAVPESARLNHIVSKSCRTSWKCRLHPPLWWLASSPGFRKAYLELCIYLDEP